MHKSTKKRLYSEYHIPELDTADNNSEKESEIRKNLIDFPIIENKSTAIIWPEEIKGGIDLTDTYEVTSVPEDPDTPLE